MYHKTTGQKGQQVTVEIEYEASGTYEAPVLHRAPEHCHEGVDERCLEITSFYIHSESALDPVDVKAYYDEALKEISINNFGVEI
jgi:hypothetical protein